MLKIESIKFEHNRMLVKLNDGRVEMKHLLNWPRLFSVPVEALEKNEVIGDRIIWPLLKFELNIAQILKAKKL